MLDRSRQLKKTSKDKNELMTANTSKYIFIKAGGSGNVTNDNSVLIEYPWLSYRKIKISEDFLIGKKRHFSAPIVQCFKETLENAFYNKNND